MALLPDGGRDDVLVLLYAPETKFAFVSSWCAGGVMEPWGSIAGVCADDGIGLNLFMFSIEIVSFPGPSLPDGRSSPGAAEGPWIGKCFRFAFW